MEGIKPQEEWLLLGVVDCKEGLVKEVPNQKIPFDLLPSDLYASFNCSHCNATRERNKLIFLKNAQNLISNRFTI